MQPQDALPQAEQAEPPPLWDTDFNTPIFPGQYRIGLQLLDAAALVALGGILSAMYGGRPTMGPNEIARVTFDVAEAFVRESARRHKPPHSEP